MALLSLVVCIHIDVSVESYASVKSSGDAILVMFLTSPKDNRLGYSHIYTSAQEGSYNPENCGRSFTSQ